MLRGYSQSGWGKQSEAEGEERGLICSKTGDSDTILLFAFGVYFFW